MPGHMIGMLLLGSLLLLGQALREVLDPSQTSIVLASLELLDELLLILGIKAFVESDCLTCHVFLLICGLLGSLQVVEVAQWPNAVMPFISNGSLHGLHGLHGLGSCCSLHGTLAFGSHAAVRASREAVFHTRNAKSEQLEWGTTLSHAYARTFISRRRDLLR